MTPERARYLIEHRLVGGSFRMAFRPPWKSARANIYADGLTEDEDRHIKSVWAKMPGNTTYFDAVQRIARGEA